MKLKQVLTVLLALIVLCPAAMAETPEATLAPQLFETFVTQDIYGNEQTEALLENAPLTFVNVWGTFCGPCINEMPDLAELAAEYEGKVQFLGIVGDINYGNGVDDSLIPVAVEIAEQTGANAYTHLIPSDAMNERVLFSVNAFPTSFFLDADGRQVGTAYVGSREKDDWKVIIDEVIGGMAQ